MARARLGGHCAGCGTTDGLHFDHVDPATKVANISEITNWALPRFLAEVDKCQLLCGGAGCHQDKTSQENYAATLCPSGVGRWRCPCEQCKAFRRAWQASYMRRWRAKGTDSAGDEAALIRR